jgi:ParB-like chromosome segregation protein Spo0J
VSVKKEIKALTVRAPFKDLFEIDPDVLAATVASIKADGFDPERPIFVWRDGTELVVVEGHIRLEAARKAGLNEVSVVVRKFADEDAAFTFAVAMQRDRRNLTKLEIAEAIARFELAKAENTDRLTMSRSVTRDSQSGRVTGSTRDPVKEAVVRVAKEKGVSEGTAKRGLANVRAEAAAGQDTSPTKTQAKRNGSSTPRRKPKPKPKPVTPAVEEAFADSVAELRVSLRVADSDALALLRVLKRLNKTYGEDVTSRALPVASRLLGLAGSGDAVALYKKEVAPPTDAEVASGLREISSGLATALTPQPKGAKKQ